MFLMSVALRGGTQAAAVVTSSATWDVTNKNANDTISGGGLVVTDGGPAADHVGRGTTATTAITAGIKRYWEVKDTLNGVNAGAGICNATLTFPDAQFLGQTANGLGYINDGNVWRNFAQLITISSFTTGDILGFACDGGNKIWLAKNNVFSGVPGVSGGLDISAMGTVFPAYNSQTGVVLTANFGSSFAFTPPSGFTAFP